MPEDVNYPFSQIPIPERQSKPRSKGLTMMIDWGLPPGLQRDCIETQGLYVDDAKIAAGIPRVMPSDLLKKRSNGMRFILRRLSVAVWVAILRILRGPIDWQGLQ